MSEVHDTHAAQDQEARMAAARAKADAARAAVERRRSMSTGANERSYSVCSHHSSPAGAAERNRSASVGSGRAGSEAAGEVIIKRRPSSGGVTPHRPNTLAGAAAESNAEANEAAAAAHAKAAAHHVDTAINHAEAAAYHAGVATTAAATAAVNEAALEELRRERQRVAQEDAKLEERLQLYSEVVGLRKELAVVQEDEERLRQQLANTEAVIAASDPEVAKEVAIFEDEAQQSTLQKIWVEESEYHNPDNMEWAEIDVSNLRQRVDAARVKFVSASEKADALYAQQEEAINETTDAREREKAAIAENHEREMENLHDARAHARQVASEQHYHRHRGTASRSQQVVPKEKEVQTRQRRVDEVEFKTTAQVARMKDELAELMEEVKILKRQLDDSREATETKRRELEAALKVVEDEGADAREMKEKLLKEEEELKELKADLQGVLHYVRAKNREEEGW
jgi:DNA repair exonuclease SbcCD ATPase subunit